MFKCGVYARVSTEFDSQKTSIPNQIDYFQNYIDQNEDFELYKVYVDDGVSGKFTKRRSNFKNMLKDACDKRFDILLVKSLSRFGRNNRETLNNLNELYTYNVRAIFIEDGVDTHKNREMIGLFSWLAEQESRKISERQKFAKAQLKSRKLFPYNNPPYGYKLVKHVLTIVPEEADIVKLIYDMYLQGSGVNKIVNHLNSNNIPSRRSKLWSKTGIKTILTNPHYTGSLYYNKSYKLDTMDEKTIYNPSENWQEQKNTHEAIIDSETYNNVQIEHQKRDYLYSRRNRYSTTNLFSNLIKCGRCGDSYIKKRLHKSDKMVYSCSNYESNGKKGNHLGQCTREAIPEEELIETVNKYINIIINDPEFVEDLYNHNLKLIVTNIDHLKSELKDVDAQILKLKKSSQKLLELYSDEDISKEQYKEQNDDIQNQLCIIEEKKINLELQMNKKDYLDTVYKSFHEGIEKLRDIKNWNNELLKQYIDSITIVDKTHIKIKLLIEDNVDELMFQDRSVQQYVQYQNGTLTISLDINILDNNYSIA